MAHHVSINANDNVHTENIYGGENSVERLDMVFLSGWTQLSQHCIAV